MVFSCIPTLVPVDDEICSRIAGKMTGGQQTHTEKSHGSKADAAHIEEAHGLSVDDTNADMAVVPEDDLSVMATLIRNPIVILCVMYGNVGALMYGFDNISLSLCLDMAPFV